jgi:hypothetical protein
MTKGKATVANLSAQRLRYRVNPFILLIDFIGAHLDHRRVLAFDLDPAYISGEKRIELRLAKIELGFRRYCGHLKLRIEEQVFKLEAEYSIAHTAYQLSKTDASEANAELRKFQKNYNRTLHGELQLREKGDNLTDIEVATLDRISQSKLLDEKIRERRAAVQLFTRSADTLKRSLAAKRMLYSNMESLLESAFVLFKERERKYLQIVRRRTENDMVFLSIEPSEMLKVCESGISLANRGMDELDSDIMVISAYGDQKDINKSEAGSGTGSDRADEPRE